MPEIQGRDLVKSFAGIRAQVVSTDGELIKEPLFFESDDAIHVLNAISPGLTASLPFGERLADSVDERL